MTDYGLDLAVIGNGRTAALLEPSSRIVWWCLPRYDGDPVFCRLLAGKDEKGFTDVVLDGHVWEQPDLLKDVADAPPQLSQPKRANVLTVDRDVAVGNRDQTVDHLQRGRLAAPRRADQNTDLPRRHREAEALDSRAVAAGVSLDHVAKSDLRGVSLRPVCSSPGSGLSTHPGPCISDVCHV